jgi:Asp-tRNA(Asn)/Glu-tRNA(Gln) amidotransferase A subunit family amidase
MVMINDQNYDYTKNLHRQFFSPYNVTGLPAIVLPNGKDKNNMPTSMQIVGKKWCENIILQIANNIEHNIMYNKTINF